MSDGDEKVRVVSTVDRKRKRRAARLVRLAKRLKVNAQNDSTVILAVNQANSLIEMLKDFVEEYDESVFWVGAAFGTKGRYGTVVGWVSTEETNKREKWIKHNFTNPWGEHEATFGRCPKSEFDKRDWSHDIYTPSGGPDLILIDQLAPIDQLRNTIAHCDSDVYDPEWLANQFKINQTIVAPPPKPITL